MTLRPKCLVLPNRHLKHFSFFGSSKTRSLVSHRQGRLESISPPESRSVSQTYATRAVGPSDSELLAMTLRPRASELAVAGFDVKQRFPTRTRSSSGRAAGVSRRQAALPGAIAKVLECQMRFLET